MLLVKVGGSVITEKSQPYTLRADRVRTLAKVLRMYLSEPMVFVAGGGSFGNRVILDNGLNVPGLSIRLQGRACMTCVMLSYALRLVDCLCDEDVPVYPVQLAPFLCGSDGISAASAALRALMAQGMTPLVTGDYMVGSDGEWRVISSDDVLSLLGRELRPRLVISLTDVPGVLGNDRRIIREVNALNAESVLKCCGPSDQPDATGGMSHKVRTLLKLATDGVEAVIADGRTGNALSRLLESEAAIEIGTRVRSVSAGSKKSTLHQ